MDQTKKSPSSRSTPARVSALAVAVFALLATAAAPLFADKVLTTLTAIVAPGVSKLITSQGGTSTDKFQFQIVATGTYAAKLQATVDGVTWFDPVPTFLTGEIWMLPAGGPMTYRFNVTTCTGCSVTPSVGVSGNAQVVTY